MANVGEAQSAPSASINDARRHMRGYLSRAPWWHRTVVRLFRIHVLRVCDRVIGEGYSAGVIDSRRMHELLAIQNATLFPEREPPGSPR